MLPRVFLLEQKLDPDKVFQRFAFPGAHGATAFQVAGGLGQLFHHLGLLQFPESGTIVFAMLALVGLVDWASAALRERLTR